MSERSIFLRALELDNPADRAAYLDTACAADPALRRRVDALLAAHEGASSFMNRPAGDLNVGDSAAPVDPDRTTPVSDNVPPPEPLLAGRYELDAEIGRGGMGAVYRARQVRPVKRLVAVKLIKTGMDSRTVLARFEAERQALAILDHPNVAKVLDAGTTADGRPFFVMELVDGTPLTEYCDAKQLPVHDRLALFRSICAAVQHAHQKGVIHRDLKPGNILVETRDGGPVPKVIDFGLAKAVGGGSLTEEAFDTLPGAVAGTPLYMAPEQTAGGADVDTRTDVYALGVVLYELLTGTTPVRREALKRAALHEVLRVIREQEPPAPSSRLSESDATPSVAANRRIEPARLGRLVRGDLDWVVMRALEKDRDRRYESAAALAADVDRFLHHEPVSAGPPSRWYKARKFVRRNRAAVAVTALVFALLVAGVAGTTWGMFRAETQRVKAEQSAQAESSANDQTQKGYAVIEKLFADLDSHADVADDRAVRAALADRMTSAAEQLDAGTIRDPVVIARLLHTLGKSLLGLGYPDRAIKLLAASRDLRAANLGPNHRDTLMSKGMLARAHHEAGHIDEATTLLEEALRERTRELGPNDPDTLEAMNDLAFAYDDVGRTKESLQLYEDSLRISRDVLGWDNPDTLSCVHNLACSLLRAGRPEDARPLFEEAVRRRTAVLRANHPKTLVSRNQRAICYRDLGRIDDALRELEEVVSLTRAKLGPHHPDTVSATSNLASIYVATGRLAEALPLNEDVFRALAAKQPAVHPDVLTARGNLVALYLEVGQPDKALQHLAPFVTGERKLLAANSVQFAGLLNAIAQRLVKHRQFTAAEPLLRESLGIREKNDPAGPSTALTRALLGESLLGAGRTTDAAPVLAAAYDRLKGEDSMKDRLPALVDSLIDVSEALQRPAEVAKWRFERAKYPFIAPPPRPVG